ncbi:hypothetical protein SAMN05444409_1991 [Epilithonimonas zeae]|uniref:Uncharacterized protein n=1 Tax=Epilithonimonas zeae TaxID=1416779 RepID=A0A1N6GQT3_9FLAO|nr:hypothetical protein SAMN05444409_1991 [Epilithonimonas zeae]
MDYNQVKNRKSQDFLQAAITESSGFLIVGAGNTGLRRTRSNSDEIQYCKRNLIELFKKRKL